MPELKDYYEEMDCEVMEYDCEEDFLEEIKEFGDKDLTEYVVIDGILFKKKGL